VPWHNPRYAIAYGIVLGFSLMTRLTDALGICGAVMVIGIYLMIHRQWKNLFQNAIYYLLGFLAVVLPFCIYFYVYDALYEIQKFNTDRVKCYATSRDGHYDILVEAETDSSDATPSAITPPTTANKRSRKKVPSVERKKMEEELNESIEE
jgi:hypothetical protein